MTSSDVREDPGTSASAPLLRPELLDHGLRELRRTALRVVDAGLGAADPRTGLARLVRLDATSLFVADRCYDLNRFTHVWLLGAGKATLPIAEHIAALLGPRLTGGVIAVPRGSARRIPGVVVLEADHPVPSEDSRVAAQRIAEMAGRVGPDDLVITAFTGGSSALASAPPDGVSFAAKRELHRMLLASGAPIEQINAVRKHVSSFKGGRLARKVAPAPIINLTVPDVRSGRLDCITDPTVADESTVAEAVRVLRMRGMWDKLDLSIRIHLMSGAAESPGVEDLDIHTVLLSDGDRAVAAMSAVATGLGIRPVVFGTNVEGEAETVGRILAALAVETTRHGRPFIQPCVLLGAGGESVVTLTVPLQLSNALGGPNQEAALGFAAGLPGEGLPIAAVFMDSDGSDGGTPYAGAIVDGCTRARARELEVDLDVALARHESSVAFGRLGDLLVTGPTHTNISDLWAVVVGTPEAAQ